MKMLKSYPAIFLFIAFLFMHTTSYAQQIEETDSHSGAIDTLNFAKRYILINDLPLWIDSNTIVLSKSENRISRYKLKVGQIVRVEYQYDAVLDKERASKIYLLE